eukprot:jgi/Mesvir1/24209/Mv10923-RA.5
MFLCPISRRHAYWVHVGWLVGANWLLNGWLLGASSLGVGRQVVAAEYAVRGAVVQRAMVLAEELRKRPDAFPFKNIVSCNIGNPHALGQQPLTYYRQVMALCTSKELLAPGPARGIFSPDAVKQAEALMATMSSNGVGAYTDSQGLLGVREMVAEGISRRDGIKADPARIYLTDGASRGATYVLQMLIRGPKDAIMVPIPQYPLYSATITLFGGTLTPYYLDEATGWSLKVSHLRDQLRAARKQGLTVRSLVVINPGNPTGQVMDRTNMDEVASFCAEEGLVLMADEVYQENVYAPGKSFVSFRKVAMELDLLPDKLQLASMHSTSKGFLGECGIRGGYLELLGIDHDVERMLYKLTSISLCSNVIGQLLTGLMMSPPKEKQAVLQSLARRAKVVTQRLNQLEGVTCNEVEGALYAFPQITLPKRAREAAQKSGVPADTFYVLKMLESTGVVVVPGSGFGQVPGTYHYRTTILPPEHMMDEVMDRIATFHKKFLAEYQD